MDWGSSLVAPQTGSVLRRSHSTSVQQLMESVHYRRGVVVVLLLALAVGAAFPLEGPSEADVFAFVLGDGGRMAFHHLGDRRASTGGVHMGALHYV